MIEHPALGRPFGRRNRLRLGYRPSRLELLLLCAALAAAGVGAAVVPLAFRGGVDAAALPDGREATVGLAELAPERPSFGDPVEATLAVAADRRLVDVATITPVLDWRQYGDVSVGRSVSGDGRTAIVRFRFRLECLERACLPSGQESVVALPSPSVFYVARDGLVHELRGSWPPLRVRSRVDELDRATAANGALPFAVDAATLTAGRTGLSGGVAAALGAGSALLVLAAAGVLAWPLVRRRRRVEPVVAADMPATDALGAALSGLAAACAPAPPDERPHALDLVARALDGRGEPELALRARRLAWARHGFDEDELAALRADCEELLRAGVDR